MNREDIRIRLDRNEIPAPEELPERLEIYLALLQEWNSRMDLTAVCDENAYGKFSTINPIASWLYGADEHGAPVVRNAVVFRLRRDDFGWMTAEEATAIADGLNAVPAETMNKVLLNIVLQLGGGFGTIP